MVTKPKGFFFAFSSFLDHSTLGDTKVALGLRSGSALVSSSPFGYVLLTIYSDTTT